MKKGLKLSTASINQKSKNYFILIGILPLFLFYFLSKMIPSLSIFGDWLNGFQNVPGMTSSFNLPLSKLMDLYCKTSPLWGFIWFVFTFDQLKQKKITRKIDLIKATMSCIGFTVVIAYFFYFDNFELTSAGRPLKYLAVSDITLLFIYSGYYFITLMLSYFSFALIMFWIMLKKGR
ncbi:colicin immunity protein Cui [Pantoea sp. C8B4]|uniref:colicin immunity protein Cui n=1 Tax=Pantoea sp. C8B4 TaxID=3243083 RepID=UPI003ED95A0F